VDDHCQIRNSVLQENTYLGTGLELEDMVASPSGLRLASDGELIVVNDATLLGRSQQLSFWDWQRPLARLLEFCLKPLQWLPRCSQGKAVEFVLAGGPDDPDAWRHDTIPNSSDDFKTPRQHFRRVFLPGLSAAAQGKLRLIGLTPQSNGRLSRQPRLRRRRYLELGPGLIGEALVQFGPKADDHEQELGDAYQAAHPRASYQLGLLWRYFLDVAINRPTRLH
jgi:hypothetical protein